MPQYYAILDNGVSNSKGKAMPTRKKYVRSYLKSKGVTPTRDASMRSKRERRLRAEARTAYAKSQRSRSSTKTDTTSTKNESKTVIRATRAKETGETREAYRDSKIKRTNPLSPAEQRSGGLGNSKRERSRGMSPAEARWLDYGPKKRAIVVASNRKSPNRNYKPGKNR